MINLENDWNLLKQKRRKEASCAINKSTSTTKSDNFDNWHNLFWYAIEQSSQEIISYTLRILFNILYFLQVLCSFCKQYMYPLSLVLIYVLCTSTKLVSTYFYMLLIAIYAVSNSKLFQTFILFTLSLTFYIKIFETLLLKLKISLLSTSYFSTKHYLYPTSHKILDEISNSKSGLWEFSEKVQLGENYETIKLMADTGATLCAINASFAHKCYANHIQKLKKPLYVTTAGGHLPLNKFVDITFVNKRTNVPITVIEFYLIKDLQFKFLASLYLIRKLGWKFIKTESESFSHPSEPESHLVHAIIGKIMASHRTIITI